MGRERDSGLRLTWGLQGVCWPGEQVTQPGEQAGSDRSRGVTGSPSAGGAYHENRLDLKPPQNARKFIRRGIYGPLNPHILQREHRPKAVRRRMLQAADSFCPQGGSARLWEARSPAIQGTPHALLQPDHHTRHLLPGQWRPLPWYLEKKNITDESGRIMCIPTGEVPSE